MERESFGFRDTLQPHGSSFSCLEEEGGEEKMQGRGVGEGRGRVGEGEGYGKMEGGGGRVSVNNV